MAARLRGTLGVLKVMKLLDSSPLGDVKAHSDQGAQNVTFISSDHHESDSQTVGQKLRQIGNNYLMLNWTQRVQSCYNSEMCQAFHLHHCHNLS